MGRTGWGQLVLLRGGVWDNLEVVASQCDDVPPLQMWAQWRRLQGDNPCEAITGGSREVSPNWLLCSLPVQTVSLKSKCHPSSAAEQPLRNLRVGRMHWFITAVILLVLGFICGGRVVHREPLLCFLDTNASSGGCELEELPSACSEGKGCVSNHHGSLKPCRDGVRELI